MPNLNLSLKDLKTFAKIKGIKGYKRMSQERLISSIDKLVQENWNNGTRIDRIKKNSNKLSDLSQK